MEKILTVSVAAYNVEGYLDRTLQSLAAEGLMNFLDVIVINDGSSDRTREIAEAYSVRYPDAFRTVNKENGGYGSTVNTALALARGKYFKVLDGDDWFDTRELKRYIETLRVSDEDLILTKFTKVYENSGTSIVAGYGNVPEDISFPFEEYADELEYWIHSMAIKTAILQQNKCKLTENCFYTDMELIFLTLPYCCTVRTMNLTLNCYRLGRLGQSVGWDGFVRHYADHSFITRELMDFYRNATDLSDQKRSYLKRRVVCEIAIHYNTHYYFSDWEDGKEKILLFERCLKDRHPDLFNAYMLRPSKTQRLMQWTHYNGFGIAARFKQRFRKIYR